MGIFGEAVNKMIDAGSILDNYMPKNLLSAPERNLCWFKLSSSSSIDLSILD